MPSSKKKPRVVGIYKITNPEGAVYIGQSRHMKKRRRAYNVCRADVFGQVWRSLEKHGPKKHIFEIIHELPIDVSQEVLDEYERLYISAFADCDFVIMNIRGGGTCGGKHAESTKELISIKKCSSRKWTKLTDDQVIQIKKERASGIGPRELARKYNVVHSTIVLICQGKKRKRVNQLKS